MNWIEMGRIQKQMKKKQTCIKETIKKKEQILAKKSKATLIPLHGNLY